MRKFTHQSDVLNASLAALEILAHRLETDIIWGLPESIFPRTMLWAIQHNPERNACGYRRRNSPSWSWTSWAGPTDLDKGYTNACVRWYTLTVSGILRRVDSSRVTECELNCAQNESERGSWEPASYTAPDPASPPGLYSGSPAEGNSTGLLVGWAVTAPILLLPCAQNGNDAHTTCVLCDAFLCHSQTTSSSINLKSFVVPRAWWDTRRQKTGYWAVLVGKTGDYVEIILVDRSDLGISNRIGIFTSKIELLESADTLRWELISLS